MKNPLDSVTAEEFGQATSDRIHWVCEQATGERVLDVGCSQGIADIILGREGKRVFAIDVLEESIGYARRLLEDESELTRGLVDFEVANFMVYDFMGDMFDVVILAGVLADVTDPIRFLRKAASLLCEDGKVVVTLPFGVSGFFDHKKVYYVTGVLEMLSEGLKVVSYKFLDSNFCFVLERKVAGVSLYGLFSEAEKNFYVKERGYIEAARGSRVAREQEDVLRKELVEQTEALELEQRHSDGLNLALSEMTKGLESKVDTENLLIAEYKKEQAVLKDYADLQRSHDALVKEKGVLERRYHSLSNSRLGKVTLVYWKWRRKGK